MKRPSFFEGVAVALVASFGGSMFHAAVATVLPGAWLLRVLVATISLGYVLYLLTRSRETVGRMVAIALWSAVSIVAWWLHPPLSLYVLAHLGLIWLVRSLHFYASVLSALTDLALCGLSLAAGIWAATHTGSVLLALWCFFLVQAVFVLIPPSIKRNPTAVNRTLDIDDAFERAHQNAETALRKLYSNYWLQGEYP